MPAEKNSEKTLPISPLLNAQPPHAKSTINLNKLDKARFSTLKTQDNSKETSALRVIIYVVIVIVVGVGAALLARQLMSNNSEVIEQDANQEEQTPAPVSFVNGYSINTLVKQDAIAENLPSNSDFKTSELLTIGVTNVDLNNASLDKITYQAYETFGRLMFELQTTENKMPKANITYDTTKDTLTVEFVDLQDINTSLKINNSINGIIQEIRFDSINNKFNILFKQTSLYRVFAVEDSLYIDIRTDDEFDRIAKVAIVGEEVKPDTTPVTTPTSTDTLKPAAPKYTNEFSQNTQYVSSKVATKSIALNNYYTWDQSTFFEFSWAEEDMKGDNYVPNAKAYLTSESGKDYIMVEIENLTRATLPGGLTAEEIQTKTGVNMSNANFVALTLKEFSQETGKAIYKIELKRKANFQLLTQLTAASDTQILSIQIKD